MSFFYKEVDIVWKTQRTIALLFLTLLLLASPFIDNINYNQTFYSVYSKEANENNIVHETDINYEQEAEENEIDNEDKENITDVSDASENLDGTNRSDESDVDSKNNLKDQTTNLDSQKNKQDENEQKPVKEKGDMNKDSGKSGSVVTPFAGNLNVDVDLSPIESEIESGKRARYLLTFKSTGANNEFLEGTTLRVILPSNHEAEFNQDLEDLKIAGVTPSYNPDTNALWYNFRDELRPGRTYETTIVVDTHSLITPNNTEFEARATLTLNRNKPNEEQFNTSGVVTAKAEGSIDISKKFREARKGGDTQKYPKPGDYLIWDIKVSIPKKDIGQLGLNENAVIRITDEVPNFLDIPENENLLTVDGTRRPDRVNRAQKRLVWEIDAPTLAQQKNREGELYTIHLAVRLQASDNSAGKLLKNTAKVSAQFIGQSQRVEVSASGVVGIMDSDGPPEEIVGIIFNPRHSGPSDSEGKIANREDDNTLNPNPNVTDDAILRFSHGFTATPPGAYKMIRNYVSYYNIDENLVLQEIKTPGDWFYARSEEELQKKTPLDNVPKLDVIAVLANGDEIKKEKVDHRSTLTREDFGIGPNQRIKQVRFESNWLPEGAFANQRAIYTFTVKDGAKGKVENTFNFTAEKRPSKKDGENYCWRGELKKKAGEEICFYDYEADPHSLHDRIADPRHATITSGQNLGIPTATIAVELMDADRGEVVPGENRLRIRLRNESSSAVNFKEQMEASVLLPLGIKIKSSANLVTQYGNGVPVNGGRRILDDNFKGSGRQLIRVRWNDLMPLEPGRMLDAYFDVNISPDIAPEVTFEVFGFIGNKDLKVPTISGNPTITTSIKEKDRDDLNDNGDRNENMVTSGRRYKVRGYYDLETEKLIKGELDDDWGLVGQTKPGGEIKYKLKLTNNTGKDVHLMTLMDVLPSVGDLGITDNTHRGSKFTPTLEGPIEIPQAWKGKVEVLYSYEKNPWRNHLTRNTIWPDSATKLENPPDAKAPRWKTEAEVAGQFDKVHSFKIELVDGENFIKGQDMEIEFTMRAPEYSEADEDLYKSNIALPERWACNSFATATDFGQPVEPYKVCAYMTANEPGDLEVIKVDSEDESKQLPGAEFKLSRNRAGSNIVVETGIKVNGEDWDESAPLEGLKTDSQGRLLIENLPKGIYFLHETKAPAGYEITDAGPYEVEIKGDGSVIKKTIENDPVPKGSLTVIKIDQDTSEKLPGAEFELRKSDGKTVVQGPKTTDSEGKLVFDDLELGKYLLYETKAPEGYRILTQPIEIEIKGDSEQTLHLELTVKNNKAEWELPETGGMGTVLFYGLGLIIMLAALIFTFRRKEE